MSSRAYAAFREDQSGDNAGPWIIAPMEQTRSSRLSPAEAQRNIRLILEEGTVEISGHCRRRMRERGVDDLDLVHVLENGQIIREAEWDLNHNQWKYRVEGMDIEGEALTAITVIFEADLSILTVTVF